MESKDEDGINYYFRILNILWSTSFSIKIVRERKTPVL